MQANTVVGDALGCILGNINIIQVYYLDITRSTLQKERLTLHGFGNRISRIRKVRKYCVHKLQTADSL